MSLRLLHRLIHVLRAPNSELLVEDQSVELPPV